MPQPRNKEGAPTPEQKAREKEREQRQEDKEKSLKDRQQSYINLLVRYGLDPRDYRKVIEQAAKNGWGQDTFLKRAGLESVVAGVTEKEQFLQGIYSDYTAAYGTPPSADLIKQLEGMAPEALSKYNNDLQKIIEGKVKEKQSKDEHLQNLTGKYYQLWGFLPPPDYLSSKTNLNIYEFEKQERAKPEFKNSPVWTQEHDEYGDSVLSAFQLV